MYRCFETCSYPWPCSECPQNVDLDDRYARRKIGGPSLMDLDRYGPSDEEEEDRIPYDW